MSQSKNSEATTSKLWGGRFAEPTDAFVQRFTASEAFDRRLASQDIRGSLAHAKMLCAQAILSPLLCQGLPIYRSLSPLLLGIT